MRRSLQTIIWLAADAVFVNAAFYSGYLLRFDGVIEMNAFLPYLSLWPYLTWAHLVIFAIFKLYAHPNRLSKKEIWINTVYASTIAIMTSMSITYIFRHLCGLIPSSVFGAAWLFNIILAGGWRAFVRHEDLPA